MEPVVPKAESLAVGAARANERWSQLILPLTLSFPTEFHKGTTEAKKEKEADRLCHGCK